MLGTTFNVEAYPGEEGTQGRLVFEDALPEEVARKLERWYGLQVDVRAASGAVVGLNATFEDEPLSKVLRSIATAHWASSTNKRKTPSCFTDERLGAPTRRVHLRANCMLIRPDDLYLVETPRF